MDLFSKVLALNAIATFTPRVTAFRVIHTNNNNNNNTGLSTTGRIVVIVVCILIVALCIVWLVMRQRRAQSTTVFLPPVTQGSLHPMGGYSEAYGPPPPGPGLYPPAQAPPMQGYYAPSPYAPPPLPQRIGSEEKGPQAAIVLKNNVMYSNYAGAPAPGPSAATPGSYPFALTPTPGTSSPPPSRGYAPPTGLPPPHTR